MANLLENLEVTKIAFVDEGDNPEARLTFTKRKNAGGGKEPEPEPTPEPEPGDGGGEPTPEDDGGKPTDKGKEKTNKQRGEIEDMKFDLTKMTPEQLAQFEEIKRAALIEETEPVGKNKEPDAGADAGKDDIYKDIHPEVKKRLDAMQKRMDEMEQKEMHEIAKRYEIIGEKPDELAPKLLSIKKENPQAYAEMMAVMDKTKAMVEKAGVFSEIGKAGGSGTESDSDAAWKKIEKHAEEIMKAKPALTFAEACDAAAAQHPELVREYENNL